jgi:hypothetical protein
VLVGAWVYLMGEPPGRSPGGGFQEFAACAWRDWKGPDADVNFYRSLCAVLDDLTARDIDELRLNGPPELHPNPHPQFLACALPRVRPRSPWL